MTEQEPPLRLIEQDLRCVSLAQALERADTAQSLVSAVERSEALQQALARARQRGAGPVRLGDILLDYAQQLVARASARERAVAALQAPRWPQLAGVLAALALLLGLLADRVANAHRVDLLSPPLLAVLAWNLGVYLLLLWRWLRRPAVARPASAWWQALWGWLLRRGVPWGRVARRGLPARMAAEFAALWLARSQALLAPRTALVLHLCAAAWAGGIALSLLLRGLVVNYRFGWESTFLDAAQVHAVVRVLFWPLTALLGQPPMSLQDIAATQNFAGEGLAGSHWVWMYVGLLALVVVLPRLALAAGAAVRSAWLARRCPLDVNDAGWDALRQALPLDAVVGVLGASAAQLAALGPIASAQGDRLRLLASGSAADALPVQALLRCTDADAPLAPPPAAWQAAPAQDLPWVVWGASWAQEPQLFAALAALWPQRSAALQRLAQARAEHHEAQLQAALQALARHLRSCAELERAGALDAAAYALRLQTLDAELQAQYGASPVAAESVGAAPGLLLPVRGSSSGGGGGGGSGSGVALAVGTSAGAAAGAAAGAKVGALIDVGSGGVTLGAGTALGALVGGAAAWMARNVQKKDALLEQRWLLLEQVCTHYLVAAHAARVPPAQTSALAERWRAEVTATVAAHGAALASALAAVPPGTGRDPLLALLERMLRGMVQRSFAPENQIPDQKDL